MVESGLDLLNMTLTKFRQWTQLASTVLCNSYLGTFSKASVSTNALKGVCVPVLNCYSCPTALFACPIGTLQHFITIGVLPFYLLGYLFLAGLLTGRMACGWLCPFGFLQDLLYKLKTRKYKIPANWRYAKYAVLLLLVILLPYWDGETWFCIFCPAGTLTAGLPWAIWNPVNPATGQLVLPSGPGVWFFISVLILIGFLGWFVVSRRPFCKTACPMGAILSFFNSFSMIQLDVQKNCDGCNTCSDICPMDLNVAVEANSGECIRCLDCTRCDHVTLNNPFKLRQKVRHQ
jgi:ferredoxin-type protein NapH